MNQQKDIGCKESIAMASIPKQQWCEPYDLDTALKEGTISLVLTLHFSRHHRETVIQSHTVTRQTMNSYPGNSL